MTLSELATVLAGTNYSVRYGMFQTPPTAPYIEYQCSYSDNFKADNKVFSKFQNVDIFLFTKTKTPSAEATVETALDGADIAWDKTETYLEDEKVFQILYEVKING